MKLWKKIVLILLGVLLLLQLPFVYRRYQIGKLAEKIDRINSQRTTATDTNYREYKGIIHAHTSLGGHSTGTFDELISAANANDLDFVIMTEHYTDLYDTSALTLNGIYGKTLFVGGNEIDTADGDRFLMIPGSADAAGLRKLPTVAVLEKLHSENRVALVTYPEKFKSWDSDFDGDEIFSLHTQAKETNPFTLFFDVIWSYAAYPELTLATHFHRPDSNLKKFDEIAAKRPASISVGTDAHSNIGFHILGDDAGNKLFGIKLDRYQTIFRIVRTHVLLPANEPLTRENLLAALKDGHSFIGFDSIADSTGFFFAVKGKSEISGDEVAFSDGLQLAVTTPADARCVLLRNGETVAESTPGRSATFDVKGPGSYRVEVYLDQLGSPFNETPWIMSNPIYVR
jgi:hypothetical protein